MSQRRPLAQRHLYRLHELVSSASICRVVEDRKLVGSPHIAKPAADDRSIAEEVLTLARERGWTVPEPKPYAWQLMANYSDASPRIVRVLDRDVFELDEICRETDDDDVESLASQLRDARRSLKRELERERPELGLPGAK